MVRESVLPSEFDVVRANIRVDNRAKSSTSETHVAHLLATPQLKSRKLVMHNQDLAHQ